MTTVGYGDIKPTNATEVVVVACFMLICNIFIAYLISKI